MALAAIVAVVGHGQVPLDVTGSWNVGGAEISWPNSTAVVTFGPGNSYKNVSQGPENGNAGGRTIRVIATGTYTLQGEELTDRTTHVEAMLPDGTDEENRQMKLVSETQQELLLKEMGSTTATYRITWLDADTFEARSNGLVATFRRVGAKGPQPAPSQSRTPAYMDRPGFQESKLFWQVAMGIGLLVIILFAARKAKTGDLPSAPSSDAKGESKGPADGS
jgi:hypothetical protein